MAWRPPCGPGYRPGFVLVWNEGYIIRAPRPSRQPKPARISPIRPLRDFAEAARTVCKVHVSRGPQSLAEAARRFDAIGNQGVSSSIAMSGARRAVADAESLRLQHIELMLPDRDAHTDHVNLQLSVVSAGCVIAPDCTEKLESTSTLRFQTSARIVHRGP